ncbi:T7SS effector LXG polymorphic toxin, partial [Bacillus subtilis]|uniref:T7SS effector LXG polymorphic toxin n=1 Tax=Bacillus subtilis TaxID=1423 RepID=UPI00338E4B3A
MNHPLKPKPRHPIPTFYHHSHNPFLLFFPMFIHQYKKMLKQTHHAISSVESHSHG